MKHSCTLVATTLMVFSCVAASLAEKIEIPETVTMSPAVIEDYVPKQGDVVFPHGPHLHLNCADCHHNVLDTYTFQSCLSEGCHDSGQPSTDPGYIFRAFHTRRDTTKSCLGCHRVMQKEGAEAPTRCKQCHQKKN